MRTRTKDTSSPVMRASYLYWNYYGDCTDPKRPYPPGTTNPREYGYDYRPKIETVVTEDIEIPGYYRRSAKGEIFCNPYKRTKTVINDPACPISSAQFTRRILSQCSTTDIWHGSVRAGVIPASILCAGKYSPTPYIDTTPLIDAAVHQAWSNISHNEVDSLVMIGEGKETAKYLCDTFSRAVKIFKAVRKLDLRALRGELSPRELKKRYLEARYAIRPLISDVQKVVDYLTKSTSSLRYTFRGKTTASATTTLPLTPGWLNDSYDVIRVTGDAKRDVEVRAGVLTSWDSQPTYALLGIDRPIEALVELIPFSFIIEWFIDVGRTIGAWTPKFGFKALASWAVVTDTTVYTTRFADWTSGAVYNKSTSTSASGTLQKIVSVKERIPHPYRAVLPVVNMRLDSLKLLDLALITEQIARRFRR